VLDSFISLILEPLWASRAQIQKYKRYRLVGPQWLQGTTSEDNLGEQWDTLVAWCQGCGFFPLVYGKNPICQRCRRLICMNENCRISPCFTCEKPKSEKHKGCELNGLPPNIRPALQKVLELLEDYGMAVERATNGTTWHTFFVQKERQAFAQHGHITELMKIVENNLKNLGRQVHITPDEISVEIQTRRSKSFKITFSFQRDESIQENVSQTTR